jgi:hypothetical protein
MAITLDTLLATHNSAMLRASLLGSLNLPGTAEAQRVEREAMAAVAAFIPDTASEVRGKANYLARRLEIGAVVEPATLLAFVYSLAAYQAA